MKVFPLTALASLSLFLLVACNPVRPVTSDQAADYNDAIVSHGDSVLTAFDAFTKSIEEKDRAVAERRLHLATVAAARAVEAVGAMPPLEGNTDLRDAALDLMKFYAHEFENGFRPHLGTMLLDTLDEEAALQMDAFINHFAYMEDSLHGRMLKAQMALARKYELEMN